jgi:hypothetical protein
VPKVGSKHFPYTNKGIKAAKKAAKKSGKKVERPKTGGRRGAFYGGYPI